MKQHALQTALTLYKGGTLDLETAARQAGVAPSRLELAVDRLGGLQTPGQAASARVPVSAD